MNKFQRRSLAALLLAFTLSSCGGGDDVSSPDRPPLAAQVGTVAVSLTDGTTDETTTATDFRFDEVNASIAAIFLIGADGPVSILSNPVVINLRGLGNVSDMIAIEDVPAGRYEKVRMILTNLELIEYDENGDVAVVLNPPLPIDGRIDLFPAEPIQVLADGLLHFELDFDVEKSITIGTTSGEVTARPVIFIRTDRFTRLRKLARVHGVITRLDEDHPRFVLCPRWIITDQSSTDATRNFGHCIVVRAADNTGIFDSQGDPTRFAELSLGQELTAIGFPAPFTDVIAGDDVDVHRRIALDAVTLEIGRRGAFAHLRGITLTRVDPDTGRFGFLLAPNQGFTPGSTVRVQLQVGTRIFALNGAELDASEIRPEYRGLVDGVIRLSAGSPALVKSALVILKRTTDFIDRLRGIILEIDLERGSLLISSEIGDRCLITDSETRILLITRDAEENTQSIERVELADLQAGMGVHAYGKFLTGGCLATGTLIAFTVDSAGE
ncbi:MAG: DUF4382 domain-containing protein [Gammaproteobacteria bacterium]|nr:DUF4382 domain-containing protein [Gammaproteobacteria bacterium]